MTLAGPRAPSIDPLPPPEEGKAGTPPRCGFYLAVGNEAVKFNVLEREGGAVRGWIRQSGLEKAEAAACVPEGQDVERM